MTISDMMLSEKLGALFREFERGPSDRVEVTPSGGGQFMVAIASTAFEGLPEEDRQDRVWRKLIDELDDEEQSRVEFVFTDTPAEVEEMRRASETSDARS